MTVLAKSVLSGCSSIPDFIAGGSLMLFQQQTAPTSWTKQTNHNNKALRVVGTTDASPSIGGIEFTTAFTSRTPSGSVSVSVSGGEVQGTTLQVAQIPSHFHGQRGAFSSGGGLEVIRASGGQNFGVNQEELYPPTSPTGGDGAHSHPFAQPTAGATFTGDAQNFNVSYVDVIICKKD